MKKQWIFLLPILILIGCKKKPVEPTAPEKYEGGYLALNEGLFEQNNASLSYYSSDDGTTYQQVFKSENNRGLGDTANDFTYFTSNGVDYIIIAVDISSQIEIVERYTLKSVKQIALFNGAVAREPRRIEIYGSKAFVCNFDGTVAVINLDTFELEKVIEVGQNPDGMVAVDSKLFVTNSGGLNYPIYDSTVSIIDMESSTNIGSFTSRINCGKIIADSEGELYIHSVGNYDDIGSALVRVDADSHEILDLFDVPMGSMSQLGDWIYFYHSDDQVIYRFNMLEESFDYTPFIDVSGFETFGGLQMDVENDRCYAFELNGYVNSSQIHIYNLEGNFIESFTGGLITKKLIKN